MGGNDSSWETRTRIPRKTTTRNKIRMIKVSSRRRRIEQKHKDSNEKHQQQGNNNDRNRQTDKTTNMIRRIRVRRSRI